MGFCSNYVNKGLSYIGRDRANVWKEFMYQLGTNANYYRDVFWMRPFAFAKLCELFRETSFLKALLHLCPLNYTRWYTLVLQLLLLAIRSLNLKIRSNVAQIGNGRQKMDGNRHVHLTWIFLRGILVISPKNKE